MKELTEMEAIERLYNLKRSKYDEELITDELDQILFDEAVKEIACSAILNGGRKIRK